VPARLLALALAAVLAGAALGGGSLVQPSLLFRANDPEGLREFRQQDDPTGEKPPLEPTLAALAAEVAEARSFRGRLEVLCRGLRGRMPGHPEFPGRRGTAWPARPLTGAELLADWESCRFADTLSTAFLALRIGRAAGLDCRAIGADSGAPWRPGCVAGLEVRSPEGGWVFVDPTYGVAFSRDLNYRSRKSSSRAKTLVGLPTAYSLQPTASERAEPALCLLSLLELRRALAAGDRVALQPLVEPAPYSPLGHQLREYSGRLANVWLPLETPSALAASGQRLTWGLLEDELALLEPRRWLGLAASPGALASPGWSATSDLHRATRRFDGGRQPFLQPPASSLQPQCGRSPRWAPRTAAAQLALACLLVYFTLLLLRRPASPASAGRFRALPAAAVEDLRRLLLGPPARLIRSLTAFATPAASAAWRAAALGWQRLSEGPSDLYPVRPGRFLLAGVPALALLALQMVLLAPTCWEDAYISFRFARNVATGDGWTFNRGEPGVEGFSNAAWTGLLAAVAGSEPERMPATAAALGAGLQALTLLLVAWIACRLGAYSWLPALLLAGNAAVARNACSGLETPLASLLVTLVAWLWLTEEPRGLRGPALTSAACALLAATRAEGFGLFLALTAFRALATPRNGRSPALDRAWLLPFAAGFGALTLWRLAEFGAAIPHVYFARLVEERGGLLERLGPGALYMARSLLASPAWCAGLLGLLFLRHSPAAARLAAVAAAHLAAIMAAGGDAVYMPPGRFLVTVAPCLVLLAQHGLQGLAARGRWAAPPAALIALALLCVEAVAPPGGWRLSSTPLVLALTAERSDVSTRLSRGWWHLSAGRADTTLHSFDGRVARHLASVAPSTDELCSSQAGQLAWLWPGPFRDYLGLATLPPVVTRHLPGTCSNPRWMLLPPHILADRGRLLLDRGYRPRLAYVLLEPRDPAELSCLVLLERPPGTERVRPASLPFVQPGRLAWWALPREQVVLFGGAGSPAPLHDGPRGLFDAAQWEALQPESRALLAAYGWNLR
jgi:hypothetical protein